MKKKGAALSPAVAGRRAIIHVDMDAFFANVELLGHPEYQGKPLIVGGKGDPTKRGVVSAASYEARKYGIESGMPLKQAYRLCPQAIFLPVDFQKYQEVSQKFKAILRKCSPLVESFGLDEAFLDVTEAKRDAEKTGKEIKERIRKVLNLTASVGIAPNKLLAKIASGLNKPDGFKIIKKEEISKELGPLPVRVLFGVGEKTEVRLKNLGIKQVGELAKIPRKKLTQNFGEVFGRMLYNHARGLDDSPIVPFREPKSFGKETTFENDTRDLNLLKATLLKFSRYLWKELKEGDYQAKTVTVKLRFSDFSTYTKAHTLKMPFSDLKTIFEEAQKILGKYNLNKKVRLIGLRLSHLQKSTGSN